MTLDAEIYEALHAQVRRGHISTFIEQLIRPHLVTAEMEAGYRAMAADSEREREAEEWCEGLIGETLD